MNVDYVDGTRAAYQKLTAEEVAAKVREALEGEKPVDRIEIVPDGPNRHERRRQAAVDRRNGRTAETGKG